MADMFHWRSLTTAINQIVPPEMFITNLIFGRSETHLSDTIDVEIIKGNRKLAPFSARYTAGKVIDKGGKYSNTIKTPTIRIKKPLDAKELLVEKFPVSNVYTGEGSGPQDHARRKLAFELQDLRDRIDRRIEWMSCKALTGGFSYTDDDITFEIDYLFEEDFKPVLTDTAVWGGAAANILGNLRTWKRLINDKGYNANVAVLGTAAADELLKDEAILKLLDNRNVALGTLKIDNTRYLGRVAGLDLYEYSQSYVDDAGTVQQMFDPNAVVVAATGARFTRHYGAIIDLEAGNIAQAYFSKTWDEKDPSVRWILGASNPLPVVHENGSVVYATVK